MKIQRILKRVIIILVFILIIIIWTNKMIVVTEYTVDSEKIPKNFDGFTILQISDLHNAEFGKNNSRLINKINKVKPDIIIVTGDIIDSRRTDIEIATAFVKEIVKIAPTYYVNGNHEFRVYNEYLDMEKDFKELGVTVLRQEDKLIEINGEFIQIIGIDASVYKDGNYYIPSSNNLDVLKVLEEINNKEYYSILLAHRPELFPVYKKSKIDLSFSGHTHGGQIRIPFLGGVIAPNQDGFFPKYDSGLFIEDDSTLIINRGLGNSILPIRVNNIPEVVVVKLKSNIN